LKHFCKKSELKITVSEKVITNKEYKNLIEEVAEVFYDFYRQHQKNQVPPSSESGNPHYQPEVLDESV